MNGSIKNKLMTLKEAKAYMISNPGVNPIYIGGQPHYRGITIGG
jgi:hypothetical protein